MWCCASRLSIVGVDAVVGSVGGCCSGLVVADVAGFCMGIEGFVVAAAVTGAVLVVFLAIPGCVGLVASIVEKAGSKADSMRGNSTV